MKRFIAVAVLATAAVTARAECTLTETDRAVFDRVAVAHVKGTTSLANEAAAIANGLLWQRNIRFMPQPREVAFGYITINGNQYSNVKWDDEEKLAWEAYYTSAITGAGAGGLKMMDVRLVDRATYVAWEAVMYRRQFATYECTK